MSHAKKIPRLNCIASLLVLALIIVGPALAERGGDPVLGTLHEEQCGLIIAAVIDGSSFEPFLADLMIVGPGFAHAMSGDQAKFPYGEAIVMTGYYGGRQLYFLGRSLLRDEQTAMLKSGEFRELLLTFKGIDAKPATAAERELYYSLIAWQIEGMPVTVITHGTQKLLFHNTEEGKLFYIDMINQYPVPSVASSFEDARKLLRSINGRD